MRLLNLNLQSWRGRFWAVLTVLLIVLLASHPELRLLAPFLDAIGLDVLLSLFALQFTASLSTFFMPLFYRVWSWLGPPSRVFHHVSATIFPFSFLRDFARYAVFNWVDRLGPDLWLRMHLLFSAACMGPNNSFKPKPLRGSA